MFAQVQIPAAGVLGISWFWWIVAAGVLLLLFAKFKTVYGWIKPLVGALFGSETADSIDAAMTKLQAQNISFQAQAWARVGKAKFSDKWSEASKTAIDALRAEAATWDDEIVAAETVATSSAPAEVTLGEVLIARLDAFEKELAALKTQPGA